VPVLTEGRGIALLSVSIGGLARMKIVVPIVQSMRPFSATCHVLPTQVLSSHAEWIGQGLAASVDRNLSLPVVR
jgi:hypothetical protein